MGFGHMGFGHMGPVTLARGWSVLNSLAQLRPTLGAIGFNSSKTHGVYIYRVAIPVSIWVWLEKEGWEMSGQPVNTLNGFPFPFLTPASIRRAPSK